MFDKIVIVLAEGSLPRNSLTEMPTADACRLTSPLACLPGTNFDVSSPQPKQSRKDEWFRQGRKGLQDASLFTFVLFEPKSHSSTAKEL